MLRILGTCNQSGCLVSQGGSCLEGLSIDLNSDELCPHFEAANRPQSTERELTPMEQPSQLSNEDSADDETVNAVDDARSVISLPRGEPLNLEEVTDITLRYSTRVIALAGAKDSGKTTILSCLNEKFQRGPYAGFQFAGSKTLPAFERICYESRMISNRSTPATSRTAATDEDYFFHLSLLETNLNSILPASLGHQRKFSNIVVSNISGEIFKRISDSSDEAQKHRWLSRADHIVITIDGEGIIKATERQLAYTQGRVLLRRLVESKLVGSWSIVDIVFTKWDLIATELRNTSSHNVIEQFLERVRSSMSNEFGPYVGQLCFYEVAARPDPDSTINEGYGLESLLGNWLRSTCILNQRDERRNSVSNINPRQSYTYIWPQRK